MTKEQRDNLIKKVKDDPTKTPDYKEGYIDGALDLWNEELKPSDNQRVQKDNQKGE